MSTKSINEGGPALEEMSLRDWFAGQALICLRFYAYSWQQNEHYWKNVAEAAYAAADAMLAEREKARGETE